MKQKQLFKSWPLWVQITFVLLFVYISIIISTNLYVRFIENNYLSKTIEKNQKNILNTITSTAIESIITEDIAAIDTIISELKRSNPTIYSINIYNEDKKSLINLSNKNIIKKEHLYTRSGTIKYEGETFGHITIRWDLSEHYSETDGHVNKITIFVSSMLLLLAAITSYSLHLLIIRPLRGIENGLLDHATGSSNKTKKYNSAREFNQLYKAIDKLKTLTISKRELKKEVAIRKQAQIELSFARDEALKASQAKSIFLANMSHELRTPLNAIMGYSELLIDEASDRGHDIYFKDLKKINGAGKHLLELISNILDLAKIEAGKMDFSVKTIRLHELIYSITETISPLVQQNNNKLEVFFDENIVDIDNDEMKLKQIILNLLSNACKFTKQGLITLKVQREIHFNNEWISICVEDTGIGISEENQEKIFDTFSQADSSTSIIYGGTGLGLNISRDFCQLMCGDLRVESELGKGSRFLVEIPANVKPILNINAQEKLPQKLPLLTPDQSRNTDLNIMNTKDNRRKKVSRIFILEPDLIQLENIKLRLNSEGWEIDYEIEVEKSFEKINITLPDVIIINTKTIRDESLVLIDKIKSNNKLNNIPVIVVVKEMLLKDFIEAGVLHQLPLRYDINEFIDKIKQSLRKAP